MALLCYYLFSFFLLPLATRQEQGPYSRDLLPLLSFKASADPHNAILITWDGLNPCSGLWVGVKCYKGRVVSVCLDGASLTGSAAPLFELSQLRVLSLRRNALAAALPRLTNLTNPRLRHLFLSHNQFNGTLDISLPSLLSLRVEHNNFSGGLGGLQLPNAEDFNVSVNRLSGAVSDGLSKFPISSFSGNPSLCGSPLPNCSEVSRVSNTTASISPSPTPLIGYTCSSRTLTRLGLTALLGVGVGDILVISMALAIAAGMYVWLKKKLSAPPDANPGIHGSESDHGHLEEKEKGGGGLIRFEGGEGLRLECLLKASAEVLGKGISGSTYRAVLDDGLVVAVKRLSAMQFPSRSKAFDQRVQLIGRLRHAHVVSLIAYWSAHEEKLLVYDYMPHGSLQCLLLGNNGGSPGSRSLDWRSRKEILMGAARGLSFIHNFPARPPLVHGNIKPSNILIDEQGNARVSECSLMCFATNFHQSLLPCSSSLFPERVSCTASTSAWPGYRAPELLAGKARATQESDVYSFGMVLLEVVTGKEIDEEECQGEMMGMVKIGMMCTTENPDERPKIGQVLRMMSDFL